MAIRLYNTLTNSIVDFEPREPGKLFMYNCGPTVYKDQHIGNLRSYLLADTLRRYFDYKGFDVTQVMKFTKAEWSEQDNMVKNLNRRVSVVKNTP